MGMGLFGGGMTGQGMGGLMGSLAGGITIPGLNGLTANIPGLNPMNFAQTPLAAALGGVGQMYPEQPSRFLKMENMVSPAELAVESEYQDILLDVTEECNNHGHVLRIEIPKPGSNDCGKIYVVYDNVEGAVMAKSKLNGRKFNERTIVITFLREEDFAAKVF